MIALNLTGAFLCSRALLASIISPSNGRIINIASTAGLKGYAHTSASAAATHGVIGLTPALSLALSATSATPNAVGPAITGTSLPERSLAPVPPTTHMQHAAATATSPSNSHKHTR